MKFVSIASALVLVAQTSAFAPSSRHQSTSSALHLFGGGDKKGGDAAKAGGPGMMDQLAMFKKAQEMAQKKKKLDDDLMKMDFVGQSDNGKVKGHFKYVPISNPMDPNPDYEAVKFDFDDEFYESSSPSEIAAAVKAAINNGIEITNQAVAEKYQTLQADLMEAFAKKD